MSDDRLSIAGDNQCSRCGRAESPACRSEVPAKKPSIAELQRIVSERPARDARSNAQLIIRNSAPVLLEIVAAALAWSESDDEDRAEELDALLAALAKVRP